MFNIRNSKKFQGIKRPVPFVPGLLVGPSQNQRHQKLRREQKITSMKIQESFLGKFEIVLSKKVYVIKQRCPVLAQYRDYFAEEKRTRKKQVRTKIFLLKYWSSGIFYCMPHQYLGKYYFIQYQCIMTQYSTFECLYLQTMDFGE